MKDKEKNHRQKIEKNETGRREEGGREGREKGHGI